MNEYPYVFNQEGLRVTRADIHNERKAPFERLIEEKREEFEAKMEEACIAKDIPFANMGYQTVGGINAIVYQVGYDVYCLRATENGVAPQKVGEIG